MGVITTDELKESIPLALRTIIIPHFTCEVPREQLSTLQALTDAIRCIIPAVGTWRQSHLYLGRSPFVRSTPDVEITIKFKECYGMAIDDSIYIDCFDVFRVPHEIRVAIILEELCHLFLNIKSEDMVPYAVCYLYPKVAHGGASRRYFIAT